MRGPTGRTAIRHPVNTPSATSKPFENSGSAHAAADTHADQTVVRTAAPHFVQQRSGQPGAGASERVAKRYCAAVDVHLVFIQRQLAEARQHLRGKRFIELDEV